MIASVLAAGLDPHGMVWEDIYEAALIMEATGRTVPRPAFIEEYRLEAEQIAWRGMASL